MIPDFHVTRAVGTGHSRANDVIRIRRALRATGHGFSPPEPSGVYDPSVQDSIRRFQEDFGLEPDAVINPGGPTEQVMTAALAARASGGPEAQEHLRDGFRALSRAGFALRGDPVLGPSAAEFRDADGRTLSAPQMDEVLNAARRSGEIKTAMMTPVPSPDRDSGIGLQPGDESSPIVDANPITGLIGGIAREGLKQLPRLLPLLRRLFREDGANPEPQQPKPPEKPGVVPRTVPMQNPPGNLPPFPAEPPPDPAPDDEPARTEPRPPTIFVNPAGEPRGPQIEIYPDMSDMLEQWLWVESRGTPDGQQKDVQAIIDTLYDELKRQGIPREHVGGGYRAKNDPKREQEGDYVKERFINREKGKVEGGRRSDIAFGLGEGDQTEILDINVIDTLADGESPTKREREAFEAIVELKKGHGEEGDTVKIPKSKRMTDAEYDGQIKKWVAEYVAAVKERLTASGRLPVKR